MEKSNKSIGILNIYLGISILIYAILYIIKSENNIFVQITFTIISLATIIIGVLTIIFFIINLKNKTKIRDEYIVIILAMILNSVMGFNLISLSIYILAGYLLVLKSKKIKEKI